MRLRDRRGESLTEKMSAGPEQPNFSIVIIARNEEERIVRNLTQPAMQAFIRAGGQVLVADTGSTDRTKEVARQHGADVAPIGPKHLHVVDKRQAMRINKKFIVPPEPKMVKAGDTYFDFAAARNDAAVYARHHMTLHIDTCDMLEALDWQHFAKLIAQGYTRFTYSHYLGAGSSMQRINRFYDRRIDRWKGIAHEGLCENVTPKDYLTPTGELRPLAPQLHSAATEEQLRVRYLKNVNKQRPYHIGMALDLLAAPQDPRWHHYLGREMYYTQRWRSAIQLLTTQAAMAHAWGPERSQSIVHAGECWEKLGDNDKALECYWRGTQLDPNRREPWMRIAYLHQKLEKELPDDQMGKKRDHMRAAASAAKAALAIPRTTMLTEPEANYREGPHRMLSWAHSWLGEPARAKYHWLQSVHYFPTNTWILDEGKFYRHVDAALNTDVDGEQGVQMASESNAARAQAPTAQASSE